MKVIGIMTENFTVYYDLIRALRNRGLPFVTLSLGEKVPRNVGVLITSEEEREMVEFATTVVVSPYPNDAKGRIPEIESAIDSAIGMLRGGIRKIIIGVDPGKYPGVVILADNFLLDSYQLSETSALKSVIREVKAFHTGDIIAKVGNGSPRERNRAVKIFLEEGIEVHVVNEMGTTEKGINQDVRAAIKIARTRPVLRIFRPDGHGR